MTTTSPPSGGGGRQDFSHLYTRFVDKDGTENEVGELSAPGISDPSQVWRVNLNRAKPYIFLSHRGNDAKEEIARPTHWFLTEVLNVDAFFDEASMLAGDEQMRSLIEPAHQCTHAVVLISPNFRRSKYCVMELNTFMVRKDRNLVQLIPVLWQLNDLDDAHGYPKALKVVNWKKPRVLDAPTFLVESLWPLLLEKLELQTSGSLTGALLRYVELHRLDEKTPPIPVSLETWCSENAIGEDARSSMLIGLGYDEHSERFPPTEIGFNRERGQDIWRSVASIMSSCSTLTESDDWRERTEDYGISTSRASAIHSLPKKRQKLRAFGRSDDDKSHIQDSWDKANHEWKYRWFLAPNGIGRDEANAFYYNAYLAYYKVQRVLVVEEHARQLLVCTPMNYAAYHILKERQQEKITLQRAYEDGFSGAKAHELDAAFRHMFLRRCSNHNIFFSKQEESLRLRIPDEDNNTEQEWEIDGFPSGFGGGWAKFLHSLLSAKIQWVAIVTGNIGIKRKVTRDLDEMKNIEDHGNGWTLLFRDEEVELLMGEHRKFGDVDGVQFRGGAFGTINRAKRDILVIPPEGSVLFAGPRKGRKVEVLEKIWELEMDSVVVETLGRPNDDLQVDTSANIECHDEESPLLRQQGGHKTEVGTYGGFSHSPPAHQDMPPQRRIGEGNRTSIIIFGTFLVCVVSILLLWQHLKPVS